MLTNFTFCRLLTRRHAAQHVRGAVHTVERRSAHIDRPPDKVGNIAHLIEREKMSTDIEANNTLSSKDGEPERFYMDVPSAAWRYGSKPNYGKVDDKYMAERLKNHPAGSLEKLIENIVKTWEMEATHRPTPQV